MNHFSPPPDPKDFSSLEEYEAAVRLHEDFVNMSEKVTDAINNSETEEEYQKKMEELGFTMHEDEYCEGEWCQENQDCLYINLDCFQESFDETFFWKMLPAKDKIIPKEFCCDDVPESWKSLKTKEGKMIEWCLDMQDVLIFDNLQKISFIELAKQETVQNFCRSFYLTLQKILHKKRPTKKDIQIITEFLKRNDVLNAKISLKFLKQFEEILLL